MCLVLLFIANIPFVMCCYGEQRNIIRLQLKQMHESVNPMQSESQIKPQLIKKHRLKFDRS